MGGYIFIFCLSYSLFFYENKSIMNAGSLGNYQLQFTLTCGNQFITGANAANTAWELVLITVNSGLFVCERGTSSSYTGILTRQDVLDVSTQEAYSGSDAKRMIGSGFLDTLRSVAGRIAPKLPALAGIAKHGLSMVNNPYAQAASGALGSMGYGRSGGGGSGGGMSGGRRHKLDAKLLE